MDPASLQLNGVTVDPAANYRVVTLNFPAVGGSGFTVLSQGKDYRPGPIDLDALEEYLLARGPLPPPSLGRISVVP